MKSFMLSHLLLFVLASFPSQSSAAIPPVLREGTHPLWFGATFGPAVRIANYAPTQIKLVESFGIHFLEDASGPAIAFDLQQSFGDSVFTLQVIPRFVYDIQVVSGLGFYLSPGFGLGYVHLSPECPLGSSFCLAGNGFTMQVTFDGKLILGDRGFVSFRLLGFDIMPVSWSNAISSNWENHVRYELAFGGGVIF